MQANSYGFIFQVCDPGFELLQVSNSKYRAKIGQFKF